MKSLITRIAIALVITSLMGATALAAKSRRQALKLESNLKVNGTLVKKGDYELQVEEEKNELSILKNGKVVARANFTNEQRSDKANKTEIRSVGYGDERSLKSVTFGGSKTAYVIRDSQASN